MFRIARGAYTRYDGCMLSGPVALEALLFAAGGAIPKSELVKIMDVSIESLESTAAELREQLASRGVVLMDDGAELELRTSAEASGLVRKLREAELTRDLGKAGLESLAVVAYRNGATRSEIDWVRGVNSSASLRTLLMRGLIDAQEDPADKRRIRYQLTTDALAHLGIARREDLPRFSELSLATDALERDMPVSGQPG